MILSEHMQGHIKIWSDSHLIGFDKAYNRNKISV